MNDQGQQPRAPREWVELVTITNPTNPMVVRVQTTVSGRPLYSVEIGAMREGRFLRHMPVYTQNDGAVTATDTSTLVKMVQDAEAAIAVDAKRKAEAWQAQAPSRQPRQDSRDERRGGGGNNGKGRRKDRRGRDDDARWR